MELKNIYFFRKDFEFPLTDLSQKMVQLKSNQIVLLTVVLLNLFQIATDVAARGLDIPDVEHVFHYQVPRTSEVCFFVYSSSRNYRGLFMIMHPFLGCGWSVITTAQKSKCRSLLKDIRKRLWFQGVASLTITTFSSSSFSFLFFFERKSSSL